MCKPTHPLALEYKDLDVAVTLYRDQTTGVAWIRDIRRTSIVAAHPHVRVEDRAGLDQLRQDLGEVGRLVECHEKYFFIDYPPKDTGTLCDIVAAMCNCEVCVQKRGRAAGTKGFKVLELVARSHEASE